MHLALLGSWEGDGGHGRVPGLRAPDRATPPPHAASMTLSGSSAEPGGSWTFFP